VYFWQSAQTVVRVSGTDFTKKDSVWLVYKTKHAATWVSDTASYGGDTTKTRGGHHSLFWAYNRGVHVEHSATDSLKNKDTVTIVTKLGTTGDNRIKVIGIKAGNETRVIGDGKLSRGDGDSLVLELTRGELTTIDILYRNDIGTAINVTEPDLTYSGTAKTITPSSSISGLSYVVVYDTAGGGGSFKPSTTGPINVGSYVATIEASGPGGAGTKIWPFKITAKDLAINMLSITSVGNNALPYSGDTLYPVFTVKDGNANLDTVRHFDVTLIEPVNAGTATAWFKGKGNYKGDISGSYTIKKKEISVNVPGTAVTGKIYDGKTTVDTADITVSFNDLAKPGGTEETLTKYESYKIVSANYADANVNSSKTVTITVALDSTNGVARNYTLANATFQRPGVPIEKKPTPTVSDFEFTHPDSLDHKYTGSPRGIGEVTWKDVTDGGTFKVYYGDTTSLPKELGSYTVQVRTTGGGNIGAGNVTLGNYVIGEAAPPVITSGSPADTTVRRNGTIVLTVAADSVGTGAVLSYQWYEIRSRASGLDTLARTTGKTFTTPAATEGVFTYFVKVTNSRDGEIASANSREVKVTVTEPAKSISTASVEIKGTFVYNGFEILPDADSVIVSLSDGVKTDTLEYGKDYTFEAQDGTNVGAGRAWLIVQGLDKYDGEVYELYTIEKRPLTRADLTYTGTVVYNAKGQKVSVSPVGIRDGLGDVRAWYDDSETEPVDVGVYVVEVELGEGENFTGSDGKIRLGTFTVQRKTPVASDILLDGVAFESAPTGHVYNGKTQGIGTVTLNGTNEGGALEVRYVPVVGGGAVTTTPTAANTYNVSVNVQRGANYNAATISLGQYKIASLAEVVAAAKVVVAAALATPALTEIPQETLNDSTAAHLYVASLIAGIPLENGVVASVVGVSFTPAQEGTDTSAAVDGAFRYKVVLTARVSALTKSFADGDEVVIDEIDGSLTITGKPFEVSVASNDHVIPGSKDGQAVVAPISVVAGEFTVGPNPVAKVAGKVSFFWQGKALSSGTLYVYDAAGNLVTKVAVADKGVSTERRAVGSWNLVGAKGGAVAEGTYLVKGALVGKDGGKVKVSSILGVSK